ncbi:Molecular chaperone (DnaJ super) [Dipsacomyces acuminosporus]|nr:Molecular chaperone (DnaJ super) [Dipsacomyces acuminosporus]
MGKDYYGILGVSKDADDDAIKKAYRKQALKWHPDRHKDDKAKSEKMFKDISEAYEVLSDKQKRTVYDQFGEEGLKGGVPPGGGAGGGGGPGGGFGGFTPSNPEDIFAQLFGGLGGHGSRHGGHNGAQFMDTDGDMGGAGGFQSFGFGGMPGGMHAGGGHGNSRQQKEVTRPLGCTLEELYNGCTKKLKVTRRSPSHTGGLTTSEKVLQIDVKPGWKAGTKIRFQKEGDDLGYGAQDIVFVIEEKPHSEFRREGDSLKIDLTLSLDEALCGFKRPIKTLGGKTINISNTNSIIKPGQTSRMANYGMPISKQPGRFGDLLITYKVQFPSALTESQKHKIHEALTQ